MDKPIEKVILKNVLAITTPFYNSEKYLSSYFDGLLNLDYPKGLLNLVFGDNESTDNTPKLLERFIKKHGRKYMSIKLITVPKLCFHKQKSVPEPVQRDAQITNIMNALFRYSSPHDVVNIDSDVVVSSDALWKLLALRDFGHGDICSGITVVVASRPHPSHPTNVPTLTAGRFIPKLGGFIMVGKLYPDKNKWIIKLPNKVMSVDSVGSALCLFRRRVLNRLKWRWASANGQRFIPSDQWFCFRARRRGFKILVDPTLVIDHRGVYPSVRTPKHKVAITSKSVIIKINKKGTLHTPIPY